MGQNTSGAGNQPRRQLTETSSGGSLSTAHAAAKLAVDRQKYLLKEFTEPLTTLQHQPLSRRDGSNLPAGFIRTCTVIWHTEGERVVNLLLDSMFNIQSTEQRRVK
jgi:hypothetical protein